jgi:hypothetical protein
MGLDMRPLGRPKPGFEDRFEQIFRFLTGEEKYSVSLLDRLKGKKAPTEAALLEEWDEIQISPFETIRAPRVGRDKTADDWIREQYKGSDRSLSEHEFVKRHEGYYVADLAEELDGVPMYISLDQDEIVFRGEFMNDCEDLIGEDLVAEAWESKLAPEALDYGKRLLQVADEIAKEHGLESLKTQRELPDADETETEGQLHILYSLAKWLIFWGKNGHGYQADY